VDSEMNPASLLVLAPNWVGDSIFMLPAVSALKRRYPGSDLCLLAKPGILALHRASPCFSSFEALDSGGRMGRFASQWRLRKKRFDMALVFPPSFSSGLGALLSGAKLRIGRSGEGRGLFLNRRLPRADRSRHVAEEYLDLARAAGAEPEDDDKFPRLELTEQGAGERERLFREHALQGGPPLAALCPTSAFGPSKCWEGEKFAELARRLKTRGLQPYFLGAPHEASLLAPLAEAAGRAPLLLPGLPGLAACLSASAVVVANDSGPLHVAAAVGARCLGIYGPVDPKWSSPLSRQSRVLYSAEPCSPCHQPRCPLGHHDCMRKISVESALVAVLELLKR
jgi:heptosyltransferase-2